MPDDVAGALDAEEQALFDQQAAEVEAPAPETAETEKPAAETAEAPETPETPAEPAKPAQTVPVGAVQEERRRRQAAEAKAERMEQLFQQMLANQQRPAQQAPQVPEFDADPAQHLKGKTDDLQKTVTDLTEFKRQQEARAAQDQQLQNMRLSVQAHEEKFRTTAPDYDEALNFLRAKRAEEYSAMGYEEAEIQQALHNDTTFLVQQALQRGRNPAETAYTMAKTLGYQKKAAEAPKAQPNLATIARGQRAAVRSGNSAGAGEMTLERLAELDGAEFDKHWRKLIGPDR